MWFTALLLFLSLLGDNLRGLHTNGSNSTTNSSPNLMILLLFCIHLTTTWWVKICKKVQFLGKHYCLPERLKSTFLEKFLDIKSWKGRMRIFFQKCWFLALEVIMQPKLHEFLLNFFLFLAHCGQLQGKEGGREYYSCVCIFCIPFVFPMYWVQNEWANLTYYYYLQCIPQQPKNVNDIPTAPYLLLLSWCSTLKISSKVISNLGT